ncbi:MAG: peptidoglycan-binding domain-containing protein [Azospirillaceae bacterium]
MKTVHKRLAGATAAAAVVLTAGLAASQPAHAADAEGNFRVIGSGFEPCSRLIELRDAEDPAYFAFRSFMNGYTTAFNALVPNVYSSTSIFSMDALYAFAVDFCADNPETLWVESVGSVLAGLEPLYLSQQPEPFEITNGENTATIPREFVTSIQQALRQRGLYGGAIDGIWGQGSQSGITRFQEEAGLEVTGVPDTRTLFELFLRGEGAAN